jgi:hypothetical protein
MAAFEEIAFSSIYGGVTKKAGINLPQTYF